MTAEAPITTEFTLEEAAREAEKLIGEFKTTLLENPEFCQRAGRAFLRIKDEKDEYPSYFKGISFRSGAFTYIVDYSFGLEREELRITKHPQKEDARYGWSPIEVIDHIIDTVDFGPSPQYGIEKPPRKVTREGIVQYSKRSPITEPHELYTNNQMAIEKIRGLLQELSQK